MRISDWSSDVCSSDLTTALDRNDAAFAMRLHVISRQFGQPPRRHQVDVKRGLPHCVVIVPNALAILAIDHAGSGIVEDDVDRTEGRSEEHTSELQSLMRISYAVFCLKKKNQHYK